MYRSYRNSNSRSCQAARLNQPPRRRAMALPKLPTVSIESILATVGLAGLLAWAWIVSRHL